MDICTDSAKAMVGRTTDTLVLIRAGAPNDKLGGLHKAHLLHT